MEGKTQFIDIIDISEGRWFDSRPLRALWSFLGKTVYSILLQSTQLQNGYLAQIRQYLE